MENQHGVIDLEGLTFDDIQSLVKLVSSQNVKMMFEQTGVGCLMIEPVFPDRGHTYMPHFMPAPPSFQNNAHAVQMSPIPPAVQNEPPAIIGNIVTAPIIGTFYSAPSPDEKPFVSVGQKVQKGDVLLIIESMKLMNEVQSEFNGIVKEILVTNGENVEFGQNLMIIE